MMSFKLNQVHCGDALEMLKQMPDESVQCCVTSPPYWGLRDYKVDDQIGLEATPQEFVKNMVEVFGEVRRVLRPDGVLWLNLGDSYAGSGKGIGSDHGKAVYSDDEVKKTDWSSIGYKPKDLCGIPWRVAFALQEAGWYLRCDVIWSKPNPMPESVQDRPTKAHEYLFLLAKSGKYFYDAEAVREKTGDDSDWEYRQDLRAGKEYNLKEPYKNNLPGCKRKDKFRNSSRYLDHNANRDNQKVPSGWNTDKGSHGRIHPEGRRKPDKQRGHGRRHAGFNDRWDEMPKAEQQSNGRNKRTVWEIATKPYTGAHFATFPTALVEPCILAGSSAKGQCPKCGKPYRRVTESEFIPQDDVSEEKGVRGNGGQKPMDESNRWEGYPRGTTMKSTTGWKADCDCNAGKPVPQIILDPFAGSGTTGLVAIQHGRKFIGFDLNADYCKKLATPRLAAAERGQTVEQYEAGQLTIFEVEK